MILLCDDSFLFFLDEARIKHSWFGKRRIGRDGLHPFICIFI